jgi:hypothetical protein
MGSWIGRILPPDPFQQSVEKSMVNHGYCKEERGAGGHFRVVFMTCAIT